MRLAEYKAFIYGYNSSCTTGFQGMRSSTGLWLYLEQFYFVRKQRHNYASYLVFMDLMDAFIRKSILIPVLRVPKSCFDIGKVCLRPELPFSQFFKHDK